MLLKRLLLGPMGSNTRWKRGNSLKESFFTENFAAKSPQKFKRSLFLLLSGQLANAAVAAVVVAAKVAAVAADV